MQPPADAPAGARLVGRASSALLAPLVAAIVGAAALGRGPVRQTLGAVLGFCGMALVLFVFFRVWGRPDGREYNHDGNS